MKKIFVILCLIIISCSYSVHSNAYPHLKTISIGIFANKTVIYGMEEEISNSLTENFNNDGRLKVVSKNADSGLTGEILSYENKIFSFDENGVEKYKVKILFKIKFFDNKRDEIIWKNERLLLSESYSSVENVEEYKTEEDAQKGIFQDLFDEIMKNSLNEW